MISDSSVVVSGCAVGYGVGWVELVGFTDGWNYIDISGSGML